ncbi:MAG: acyl-CoA thioesterase [Pseudolabrys sp.]|nr:acyl-CoA thioesterase [Pseudolabrys sp.]
MTPEIVATEAMVSVAPVTVRRTVRWSECDPAGVVYLGNYPGYLLSAIHFFRRHLFGGAWVAQTDKGGFQTPGKAIAQVFKSSLWPDDVFDMQVFAGDVRRNTYDVLVRAVRTDNGRDVFYGRVTSIVVAATERTSKVGIPQPVADALRAYRAAHAPPDVLLDPKTWLPDAAVNP